MFAGSSRAGKNRSRAKRPFNFLTCLKQSLSPITDLLGGRELGGDAGDGGGSCPETEQAQPNPLHGSDDLTLPLLCLGARALEIHQRRLPFRGPECRPDRIGLRQQAIQFLYPRADLLRFALESSYNPGQRRQRPSQIPRQGLEEGVGGGPNGKFGGPVGTGGGGKPETDTG